MGDNNQPQANAQPTAVNPQAPVADPGDQAANLSLEAFLDRLNQPGADDGNAPNPADPATPPPADPGPSADDPTDPLEDHPEGNNVPEEVQQAIAEAGLTGGREQLVQRVHRLVDDRDTERNRRLEAERSLADAQAALQQAQTQQPAAASGDRFGVDPEIRRLGEERRVLEHDLQWLDNHLDGGTYTHNGQEHELSAEEVTRFRRDAERRLAQIDGREAARRESLDQSHRQQEAAFESQVHQAYPSASAPNSSAHQWLAGIEQQLPEIKRFPDWKLVALDALAGRRLRESRTKKGTAAPRTRPTPVTTRPAATPPPEGGEGEREVEMAHQQFQQGRSVDDFAGLIAARRRNAART